MRRKKEDELLVPSTVYRLFILSNWCFYFGSKNASSRYFASKKCSLNDRKRWFRLKSIWFRFDKKKKVDFFRSIFQIIFNHMLICYGQAMKRNKCGEHNWASEEIFCWAHFILVPTPSVLMCSSVHLLNLQPAEIDTYCSIMTWDPKPSLKFNTVYRFILVKIKLRLFT